MPITHVQLFSVPVTDQDRALDFSLRVAPLLPPGGATSLTLVTWFPTMAAGSLQGTVLEADGLERTVESLRTKGVQIGAMEAAPWGRFVTFHDPDGNGIVLQETAVQS